MNIKYINRYLYLFVGALPWVALQAETEEAHEHEMSYIDEGHVDIALVYHEDEGELEFALYAEEEDHDHEDSDEEESEEEHEHEHEEGLDFDATTLLAGANTEFTLPESGDYSFLGEPGAVVYILPQDPTAGPPAPGFEMEFETGVLTDDQATVHLVGLEGPGSLIAYQVDTFGDVTIIFDSRDGFDESDTYVGAAETHAHLNWAFTAPGIYHVNLQAAASLAEDELEALSSEATLIVQAGAGAAYLRHIDAYEDGWATTENLGYVYDPEFPWMYMPSLGGWSYASGDGGEEMWLYAESFQSWLFTGAELAPWCFDTSLNAWVYLMESSGTYYYYNSNSGQWLVISE